MLLFFCNTVLADIVTALSAWPCPPAANITLTKEMWWHSCDNVVIAIQMSACVLILQWVADTDIGINGDLNRWYW